MHRFPPLMLALLALLMACDSMAASAAGFLSAQGEPPSLQTPYLPAPREQPQDANSGISPDEAARRAQEQNGGGRVLAVEASGAGYRVKLLRDGEVRVIYVQ